MHTHTHTHTHLPPPTHNPPLQTHKFGVMRRYNYTHTFFCPVKKSQTNRQIRMKINKYTKYRKKLILSKNKRYKIGINALILTYKRKMLSKSSFFSTASINSCVLLLVFHLVFLLELIQCFFFLFYSAERETKLNHSKLLFLHCACAWAWAWACVCVCVHVCVCACMRARKKVSERGIEIRTCILQTDKQTDRHLHRQTGRYADTFYTLNTQS